MRMILGAGSVLRGVQDSRAGGVGELEGAGGRGGQICYGETDGCLITAFLFRFRTPGVPLHLGRERRLHAAALREENLLV